LKWYFVTFVLLGLPMGKFVRQLLADQQCYPSTMVISQ
jgi:hypothetical protein